MLAALAALLLLAAEAGAFAALALQAASLSALRQGWQTATGLASLWPWAGIVLGVVAAWMAFRLLGSAFNLFASLAEPEEGGNALGFLAGLAGLALLGGAAAALAFPERWMPAARAWGQRFDPLEDRPESYLAAGVPWLPLYLLLAVGASLHSFRLMGDDKQRCRSGGAVSAATMHWWEFLGGWPGSLAGMAVFRHKGRSLVYLLGLVLAVAMHAGAVAGVLWLLKPRADASSLWPAASVSFTVRLRGEAGLAFAMHDRDDARDAQRVPTKEALT